MKSTAGVLLSCLALGSLVSGALYGARNWQTAVHHRFGVAVSALAVGACMMLLANSMVTYGIILIVVGSAIAPSLIGANSVIEQLAPPRRLTEAFAWLGTSLGFGVAFGSAVAGNIIDAFDAKTAMLLPAGCAVLGAIIALSLLKLLNPQRSRPRSPSGEGPPTREGCGVPGSACAASRFRRSPRQHPSPLVAHPASFSSHRRLAIPTIARKHPVAAGCFCVRGAFPRPCRAGHNDSLTEPVCGGPIDCPQDHGTAGPPRRCKRSLTYECQTCFTFRCKEKLTSRNGMEVQTSDLKQVRKAAGLTQAQLAQLTGVSRQTIIATERGDYAPSVYLALRIARALNTTVEEIFSLQEESP